MTDAPAAESPPRATEPASPMARPGAESAPAADTPSLASTPRRDAAFAAAETPRTAPQAVAAQSEDFSVDSKGDGSGRIVSARGDVFTGEFKAWRRHGFGIQHWRTGEVYEGTWDSDRQHEGLFIDAQKRRWRGNFLTQQVFLVLENGQLSTQSLSATQAMIRGGSSAGAGGDADADAAAAAAATSRPIDVDAHVRAARQRDQQAAMQIYLAETASHTPRRPAHSRQQQHQQQGAGAGAGAGSAAQTPTSRGLRTTGRRPRTSGSGASASSAKGALAKTVKLDGSKAAAGAGEEAKGEGKDKDNAESKSETKAKAEETKTEDEAGDESKTEEKGKAGAKGKGKKSKTHPALDNLDADYLWLDKGERFPGFGFITPGPGRYTPVTPRTSKSFSMGKVSRSFFDQAVIDSVSPGPVYNPSTKSVDRRAPTSTWGAKPVFSHFNLPVETQEPPGPGLYSPRSTIRGRALATAVSAPGVKFDTATKEPIEGQFISKGHERNLTGQWSPGPAAYAPHVNERLSSSRAPSHAIGVRQNNLINAIPKDDSVGPGSYTPFRSIETTESGVSLTYKNTPRYTVGRSVRVRADENMRKVPYTGPQAQRENLGLFSPGPAAYAPHSAVTSTGVAGSPRVAFSPHVKMRSKDDPSIWF